MTVATPPGIVPATQGLLPELDAAARASADAHDTTRALTDTVVACQTLPAEIYQYAPYLSHSLTALTAATTMLAAVTGHATADPSPEHLYALRRATADLGAATADLRGQIAALANAASWYAQQTALPPAARSPREPQL